MGNMSLDQFREFFIQRMNSQTDSHFGQLGLQCSFIEAGRAGLVLPYNPLLVGNPATGVMAGGPMTALLDSCCAIAAATATENIEFSPTLDLRMDHMGLAEAGKDLQAEAEVYRVTPSVIFTRGIIYQDDPERPIVRALANFTPIAHTIVGAQHTEGGSRTS